MVGVLETRVGGDHQLRFAARFDKHFAIAQQIGNAQGFNSAGKRDVGKLVHKDKNEMLGVHPVSYP